MIATLRRDGKLPLRQTVPGGPASQTHRQLLLLRWLAAQNDWVSRQQLLRLYPAPGYRTLARDLRQLQAIGIGVEDDGTGMWRLRRSALRKWLGA